MFLSDFHLPLAILWSQHPVHKAQQLQKKEKGVFFYHIRKQTTPEVTCLSKEYLGMNLTFKGTPVILITVLSLLPE